MHDGAVILSPDRYEHFLHLDDEIADLESRAKKRQMTLERVSRREKRHILRDLHPNRRH